MGCSHTSCITSLSFHGGWEKNILLEHGAKDECVYVCMNVGMCVCLYVCACVFVCCMLYV